MQVSEDIQMIVFNICIQWIVCELNSKIKYDFNKFYGGTS